MTISPTITVPRQLLEQAHAVMRETGWHLATAYQKSEDGVIEAAASEIEEAFAHLLGKVCGCPACAPGKEGK